jgi:spore coat protein U-like protein
MKAPASLLVLALLLPDLSAQAAESCTINVNPLAFGIYAGTQIPSSTTLTVACQQVPPVAGGAVKITYTVSLSAGGSGSFAQRRMTRVGPPADTLPYNLYLTSVPAVLNTSVWGDGTGGTIQASGAFTLPPNGKLLSLDHIVAGAIPAGPLPTIGDYADNIFITVVYQ